MQLRQETLAQRVVLKPYIEKVSKGGIVIARDARQQAINTNRGEIVLIGPSAWDYLKIKPGLKPGDRVYYSHYGAKTIRNEGQPDPEADDAFFIIANDEDILVGYSDE